MLTLEYLAVGSDRCPLIRLHSFDRADIASLTNTCKALANTRWTELQLHLQPWVLALDGCRLTLRAGLSDRGVSQPPPGESFVMEYAREGWREVADKMAPFLDGSTGFQWLTNEGDVNVLLSPSGEW